MKALKIFNRYIFCILFFCFLNYGLTAQLKEVVNNNQTQDWIFGDGPEPKWVIELLHGAYQNVKEDNSFMVKIPVTSSGIKYSASVDGLSLIHI